MALNKTLIQGRLVADPEMRIIGEDVHVVTVRIAVDRDRVNKETGEREADFFDVVAWRGTCDFLVKYFAKGDPIVVDGRLQSRNWTDKDGNKRYTVEIIAENLYFGSAKKSSVGNDAASTPTQQSTPAQQEDDGELPF
ncbi:MAG: single-stranded DNA-binding protein [Prevotella copri]|nr:single-stranded DNA-binding protein [Segatella copri]